MAPAQCTPYTNIRVFNNSKLCTPCTSFLPSELKELLWCAHLTLSSLNSKEISKHTPCVGFTEFSLTLVCTHCTSLRSHKHSEHKQIGNSIYSYKWKHICTSTTYHKHTENTFGNKYYSHKQMHRNLSCKKKISFH
jgi:hypothetical protein